MEPELGTVTAARVEDGAVVATIELSARGAMMMPLMRDFQFGGLAAVRGSREVIPTDPPHIIATLAPSGGVIWADGVAEQVARDIVGRPLRFDVTNDGASVPIPPELMHDDSTTDIVAAAKRSIDALKNPGRYRAEVTAAVTQAMRAAVALLDAEDEAFIHLAPARRFVRARFRCAALTPD